MKLSLGRTKKTAKPGIVEWAEQNGSIDAAEAAAKAARKALRECGIEWVHISWNMRYKRGDTSRIELMPRDMWTLARILQDVKISRLARLAAANLDRDVTASNARRSPDTTPGPNPT